MFFWNDVDALGKLARILPYVFIFLGFIVAASGQFAKARIDLRIDRLHANAEYTRRNTAPRISPYLANSAATGELLLVVDAENTIPYKSSWLIVTMNNQVVSPIMTDQLEVFPNDEEKRFLTKVSVNPERIANEYVELRFRWESIYSRQLNSPHHLHGEIKKSYRFADGQVFPWPSTVPQ